MPPQRTTRPHLFVSLVVTLSAFCLVMFPLPANLWTWAGSSSTAVAASSSSSSSSSSNKQKPTNGTQTSSEPFYRVRPGDNLTAIARRFGVRVSDLVAWNQLADPDRLSVGQILMVTPPPTRQLASRGELAIHASADEVEMLARLVQAEAGQEPFWGRVAVAAVVINRMHHDGFPASIEGVIRQPGQFPPAASPGFARIRPDELSRAAALTALQGVDPTGGALFFYNPQVVGQHGWWQGRSVQAVIGSHAFTL